MHGLSQGTSEEDYRARLAFEIDVITRMQYPGYFLIVADFIKWAKSQGIPVGPGRGSGAGSLVAYALTITDLDPIRFGLLFERFLNPERVSMPDFDIDFCQDRRGEVIDYVQQRYGRDQVAQIITFGTLQARGVLRDVGRVLQMPYGQVDKLTKLVPQNPAAPVTLAAAIASEPKLQAFRDEDAVVARAFDIAQRLEGLTRHASTHAAGIVIGDRPLSELVPLYRDPKSDMPVTQFNMKWVEPAGLVKFDFLGLKTLTVLDVAVKLLKQRNIDVDLATLPLDDAPSYQMLARGDVVGVFQVESQGMRRALVDMRPDRFEDIIALVALYRPGPMANIPTYCARKHGDEEPEYLHPMLEPILKETFGVIIYQEQVMQIAQVMAGYSLGEADLLRRAMGKKIRAEMEKQRARFIEGSVKNGVPKGQADTIFELLAKFADYGFNKSHAAAYALVSYHTAYMKAHYPVEFLAASMTLELNNTDKLSEFRAEAQRLGIKVEAPNINRSGPTFEVGDNTIYYALAALKGVGPQAVQLIVETRKEAAFTSLADFAARVSPRAVNKRVIESLAAAGAFDTLDSNRARVFGGAEAILAACQRSHEASTLGQNDMFGGASDAPTIMLPQIEPWLPAERLRREYDAIGFFLSGHPLDDYATVLKRLRVQSWAEFSRAVKTGATAGKVAATVVSRMERRTKTGNKMGIMGLSDPTGHFEAVLFSEGPCAISRRAGAGGGRVAAARRRTAGRGRAGEGAARRAAGCRRCKNPKGPAHLRARHQAAGFDRAPAEHAGAGAAGWRVARPAGKTVACAVGRRRWRRVAGHHARPRNRGGDEASRPLQGLAADRRRDQGGVGRGRRPDGVACRLQRPRDQQLHDLVGAAVDFLDPRIHEHPRDRIFLHIAVAAVELQALVRRLHLLLRAPPLRHRRGHGIEFAGNELLDAPVDENARDHGFGLALGQFERGVLEFDDGLAERLSFPGVVGGQLDRALHRGDGADGKREALLRQLLHQLHKTVAFLGAEQVFRRRHRIVEEQFGRVGGVQADLVEVAAAAETFIAFGLEHDQRDALGTGLAGARDHDDQVGGLAVGDERLLAVDDVVVALLFGRGPHALQIGAGAGFGHGDGADEFAAGHFRQPAPFLFLGPVIQNVVRHDGAMHRDPGRHFRHHGFEILDHGRLIGEAGAEAAIGFRDARQQCAHLAQRPPGRAIDHLLIAPFFGVRRQILGEKLAKLIAKNVQFLRHPG